MNLSTEQVEGKPEKTQEEKAKSRREGFALITPCIVIGLLLYFQPELLGIKIIGLIVSIIFLAVALLGLSSELSDMLDQKTSDFTRDIVLGGICTGIALTLYYFFPFWLVNIVSLVSLFGGIYGLSLGFMKMLSYFNSRKKEGQSIFNVIFVVITQILTVGSGLCAILEAIGVKLTFLKDFFINLF